MKQYSRGSTLIKFVFLVVLLAGLGVAVEYRLGVPGTTIVDRFHAKPVVLDLDLLSGKDDQNKIRQTFHYLHHTCTSESSDLGDSVCWATISKFNEIDARVISFFFSREKLSAVRISFAAQNHPAVFALLSKRYGKEREFGHNADSYGNNIVGWIRPSGVVAINDHVDGDQEAILLWLSPGRVLMKAFGISLPGDIDTVADRATSQPNIRNHESPGNLESTHDIGCIAADKVESRYTPADLYKAVSKCASARMYKEGAFLFAVAGVYGRFDTLRVVDKSAHQALGVARMQALGALDKDMQKAFENNLKQTLGDPKGLAAACKEIMRIGQPSYYPRYMIQHGMGAFLEKGTTDALAKDFDADAAWKQSLATYLHCPVI